MKFVITSVLVLFSLKLSAQAANLNEDARLNQWKNAIVKIESIQQRYNFAQVDAILHHQTDTMHHLSQHEKYNTQGELLTIKDTIRGTGILVSDGNKVYLVTAKHVIKATENTASHMETVNDLISMKTDARNKTSNDINLMNLAEGKPGLQPFIFSSDQDDLGIISLQKESYKPILAYLKQMGCTPVSTQSFGDTDDIMTGAEILAVGFPALPGNNRNQIATIKGTVIQNNKLGSSFTANLNVYPGNTGSPVIEKDKLIGILSFQSGISTNIDAATHSYERASSAIVIKASAILPLLRELQRHEGHSSFK